MQTDVVDDRDFARRAEPGSVRRCALGLASKQDGRPLRQWPWPGCTGAASAPMTIRSGTASVSSSLAADEAGAAVALHPHAAWGQSHSQVLRGLTPLVPQPRHKPFEREPFSLVRTF